MKSKSANDILNQWLRIRTRINTRYGSNALRKYKGVYRRYYENCLRHHGLKPENYTYTGRWRELLRMPVPASVYAKEV